MSERRALIVDDSTDLRFLLRLALDGVAGFTVVGEAADGAEAVEAAARLTPDLVLLDLAMPVMDGLEAIPEIRSRSPESKIVVLSGFNARQMGAEAMRLGASSYLEKGDIAHRLIPHLLQVFDGPLPAPPEPSASGASPAAPRAVEQLEGAPEWISVLLHELQTPVTVLQGLATILQRSADDLTPESIKQSAEAIGRSAKHLRSLIETFSDLRKIDVDSLDLAVETSDVNDLVRETIGDMAEITGRHPMAVQLGDPVLASVDPARIRQALINLVANAAKFSPPDAPIEVTVSTDRADATIVVRDHGPGIPVADRPRLFQKFVRLTPDVHGTGLGLYVSRGIARAHGGDLVLADGVDEGSAFVLRLPLGAADHR